MEINKRVKELYEKAEIKTEKTVKQLYDNVNAGISEAKTKAKNKQETAMEKPKKEIVWKKKPTVFSKLTYKGGHPKLTKEKDCSLSVGDDGVTIRYGLTNTAFIAYGYFVSIHVETVDQIEKRITATRLLSLGLFALAFQKKKKNTERYLTIDFNESGIESTVLFSGKDILNAHSEIYKRYTKFLSRQQDTNTQGAELSQASENEEVNVPPTFDPYEEIKKVKELLDLGIITQEEFEQKKKELLNL